MSRRAATRTAIAVLAGATSVALSDETSPPMVAYVVNGLDSVSTRTWDGSAWSAATPTADLADESNNVVIRNCPARDEFALAGSGNAKDLALVIHDGTSWGTPTVLCLDVELADQRPFFVEYERSSGDLLVAYWDKDDTAIGYRTWDGSTLSLEGLLVPPTDKKIRFLRLIPRRHGNEIMAIWLNDDKDVYACLWDGDAWGAATQLEADAGYSDHEVFGFAWEGRSGHGVAVYGENGQVEPRYRTWDGSAWSGEFLLPAVSKKQRWIRVAGDPASDTVLMAALTDDKQVHVNAWNGSAWGANHVACLETQHNNRRQIDLCFVPEGGTAIVAYAKKDQFEPYYAIWDGSAWSAERTGPSTGNKLRVVAVTATGADGELFVIASNDDNDVEVARWDGTTMTWVAELTADHGGANDTEPFMIAPPCEQNWRVTSWTEVEPD